MVRSLGFWAAAGFLLAACVSLSAEDSYGPAAWVEIRPVDSAGEAFRPVVEDAVRYRLEGLGLVVRLRGSPPGVSAARPAAPSSASLLEGAKRAGADFALDCRYSGSGTQLTIALSWYEVPTRLMTAAVDRKGRVDLELDKVILDALDELLERVKGRVEERVAAYGPRPPVQAAQATQPGPETPAGSAAAAGPTVPSGPVETPVTELPAAGAVPQTGVPAGSLPGTTPGAQPPAAAGRYESARLLLAPSVAPFIALGAASYYFPIAYQSILQIGFLPRGTGGRLGLGGLLGVTVFQAQGTTEQSLGFLVPAGLSLRYGLELGKRWGLLFHLGAGMAMLVMSTDSLGTLTKPLPYVRSGVGAELALGRKLGLGLEVAYEVYFETPYLIMGLVPGLVFSMRL